jgi:hypothetical protein
MRIGRLATGNASMDRSSLSLGAHITAQQPGKRYNRINVNEVITI